MHKCVYKKFLYYLSKFDHELETKIIYDGKKGVRNRIKTINSKHAIFIIKL